MNAETKIHTAPAIPRMLAEFRGMDDKTRHMALQMLIDESGFAPIEADLFLAKAAEDIFPVGWDDGQYRNEYAAEDAREALYPMKRAELQAVLLTAERYASGRAAMMAARTEPMPATAEAWRMI